MGGERSVINTKPRPHNLISNKNDQPKSYLPESWGWRQVDGVNYVSDVRNQGSCGSCYVFSTQDVVSCSKLSQGCEGGFPYLVAGRYAKDFGFVEESCNPYRQQDGTCDINKEKSCTRHYAPSCIRTIFKPPCPILIHLR